MASISSSHPVCFTCKAARPTLLRCVKCHDITYCDKKCQLADWPLHKVECKTVQLDRLSEPPTQNTGVLPWWRRSIGRAHALRPCYDIVIDIPMLKRCIIRGYHVIYRFKWPNGDAATITLLEFINDDLIAHEGAPQGTGGYALPLLTPEQRIDLREYIYILSTTGMISMRDLWALPTDPSRFEMYLMLNKAPYVEWRDMIDDMVCYEWLYGRGPGQYAQVVTPNRQERLRTTRFTAVSVATNGIADPLVYLICSYDRVWAESQPPRILTVDMIEYNEIADPLSYGHATDFLAFSQFPAGVRGSGNWKRTPCSVSTCTALQHEFEIRAPSELSDSTWRSVYHLHCVADPSHNQCRWRARTIPRGADRTVACVWSYGPGVQKELAKRAAELT